MYQKCPICNGAGRVFTPDVTSMYKQCDVCNGQKIIDDKTGLPPMSVTTTHDQTSFIADLTKSQGHQLEMD